MKFNLNDYIGKYVMPKSRIIFSFKTKNSHQIPLFMLIKEYYDDDGEIFFAKILFQIDGKEMRNLKKELKEDYRRAIQKAAYPIDKARQYKRIDKLSRAIWKFALKQSLAPKFTKEDAKCLALAIMWNDADKTKEVLSYTNEYGDRVYPRK